MDNSGPPRSALLGPLQQVGRRLADAFVPPVCLACSARLERPLSPALLCVRCRGRLVPIDPRASCRLCLRPLPLQRAGLPLCGGCRVEPPAFDRLIAVWRYQKPLSEAVLALKFRRLDFLAEALAGLAFAREPFSAGAPFDLLVPVPLAPLRRLSRGFDQAERLATALGARLRLPVGRLLERPGLVASAQSRLGRAARRAAAPSRYRLRRRCPPPAGLRLLLVDDVVTTGATLRAAAELLRDAGSRSVSAFALAATPSPGWGLQPP